MKYPVLIAAALLCMAAAPSPQPSPTAPPSPPPLSTSNPDVMASAAPSIEPSAEPSATPSLDNILQGTKASPSPGPRGRRGAGAHAAPTPPPIRKGVDGVWEIQIQRGPKVEYEHMNLVQNGQTITGIYLTQDKKKYPVQGSLDAQNEVRLVVSLPDGSTILMEGLVDNLTDMRGMYTNVTERVPFTAAYRPKENWLENVNAAPGGLGGGSGPPGGGPLL